MSTQHKDPDQIRRDFADAVNMTAGELEKWLATEESQSVGWTGSSGDGERKEGSGGEESTGHKSGVRIVEVLRTKKADLSDDDLAHMRHVVSYVHRHLAQRPSGDVTTSRWRYSLMNWGHDPLKD